MNPRYLTNSRVKTYRACQRKHHIHYELGIVPLLSSADLVLGILVHLALEVWWISRSPELRARVVLGRDPVCGVIDPDLQEQIDRMDDVDPLEAALDVLQGRRDAEGLDPFLLAKARAMVICYDRRWRDDGIVPIAVEREFSAELVNPASAQASRLWRLGGKIDVIAKRWNEATEAWEIIVIEHKTSGEDITIGSLYWQRLRMDGQASLYFDGATAIGFAPVEVLWDVLAKPAQRPLKATPEDQRKYTVAKTKPCPTCKLSPTTDEAPHDVHLTAADGESPDGPYFCEPDPKGGGKRVIVVEASRLYAGQRVADETAQEYEQRILDEMFPSPESWCVRDTVVRLEEELIENRLDLWQYGKQIRESEISGRAPRNPDSCNLYNRACEYLPICSGMADADDPDKYMKIENPHQELTTLTEEIRS